MNTFLIKPSIFKRVEFKIMVFLAFVKENMINEL